MATKTTITVEDDIDGSPAEETVRSGLGAAEYETDPSAANAGRFREQPAPCTEHARKPGPEQRTRPGQTVPARRSSTEVRAWARDHGIEISERGPIPASVTEQYESATT
jgi:hypothetical protein